MRDLRLQNCCQIGRIDHRWQPKPRWSPIGMGLVDEELRILLGSCEVAVIWAMIVFAGRPLWRSLWTTIAGRTLAAGFSGRKSTMTTSPFIV